MSLCSGPIFQLWLLLLSVPVAQLRLEANVVMISIAFEYIYNNRTDVLLFLALSRKVNMGIVCKSKLIESIIQIENVIQNFVLKYSERGFYCDLTWNKVYLFPVNFRKIKHI